MPFFSIIIPTYNRADMILSAIDSVLKQEFEDWELIIVDDGSTDHTKLTVSGIVDNRVKYFWKENGERGAARNYGVKHSKGDYVFFLDSDDLLYPKHLHHAWIQLKRLKQPEFFHSRYEEVFPDKTIQVEKLNQQKIWPTIQCQNKFACQFFLRQDIANDIPFSENRQLAIGEDWLVILKIGLKHTLNISNEVHAAIVQHGERSIQIISANSILTSRNIILAELRNESSILKRRIYLELTSLAALSASLHKERLMVIKLLWQTNLKNPFYLISRRRTFAILKHFIGG